VGGQAPAEMKVWG